MKRIISLIICLTMILSSISVFAAVPFELNTITVAKMGELSWNGILKISSCAKKQLDKMYKGKVILFSEKEKIINV